jgi:hypothetical protein
LGIQPDDKIVIAGTFVHETENQNFAIVRYTKDGQFDNEFGNGDNPIVSTDFTGGLDYATDVAIQNDGLIVVSGTVHNGDHFDFGAARYYSGLDIETEINQKSIADQSSIYPNPATSSVTFHYKLYANGYYSLKLYDINGKQIMSFFSNEFRTAKVHQELLQVNTLPSGSYILQLTNGEKSHDMKFFVEH